MRAPWRTRWRCGRRKARRTPPFDTRKVSAISCAPSLHRALDQLPSTSRRQPQTDAMSRTRPSSCCATAASSRSAARSSFMTVRRTCSCRVHRLARHEHAAGAPQHRRQPARGGHQPAAPRSSCRRSWPAPTARPILVGIRPEHLSVSDAANRLTGKVALVEPTGAQGADHRRRRRPQRHRAAERARAAGGRRPTSRSPRSSTPSTPSTRQADSGCRASGARPGSFRLRDGGCGSAGERPLAPATTPTSVRRTGVKFLSDSIKALFAAPTMIAPIIRHGRTMKKPTDFTHHTSLQAPEHLHQPDRHARAEERRSPRRLQRGALSLPSRQRADADGALEGRRQDLGPAVDRAALEPTHRGQLGLRHLRARRRHADRQHDHHGFFKRGIKAEAAFVGSQPMTKEWGDWTWAYKTQAWLGTYVGSRGRRARAGRSRSPSTCGR